ncbi:MAG: phage tail tape measure protein [Proteobacteria bacterium]|jgi:TP901 family phage tail tape measure protein|nr:phage tail tape measure protein [Pseudomonadota bacterium]
MGKMNFSGMAGAIPILKNIDNSLMLMGQHLNLFSSQSAKLGQVFTPMASGATKASTATKSVTTSMTQLQAVSGRVSSSTARVTSSMSAMGAAGKSALGGIVGAGERAIATMSALSAATTSVGRSMARMGTLAAIPMAGMRGLSGAITGSLLASSAGMLLNPFNAAPLAAGYGVYTQGNVSKAASEAAAKSWQPGMSQRDIDAIKQAVMSNSRAAAGQSIYSPTDIAKMWAEYAGMGGDVSAGKITDSLSKVFTNYAQAINVPDIGTALNTLVSQNMVWNGQEKAFNEAALRNTSDMMAMLVAQTKLKGTDLNDLLKDVSPVAKAYGLSQEETYAMTGGMAQLGLNPQQAGMALRRILLRGTPNVSALEKQEAYNQGITNEKGNIIDAETGKEISLSYVNQALDQLDLTWADINPEKNTNGIVGVFQDIASKMKEAGMSPEQQQAWMKTVYGLQGVTPAQMLTQNPEYLLDLYEKIKKSSGAANSMSNIMTDNMIDQLKMLGSAVKGTAQDIGAYFEPSVVKLTKFLKDSALPGLENLGSAIAAGDWEGAADIVGSAVDFLGQKFEDSGPVLTDWINNGIDGLDEFSQRLADFTSGGGVSDLFGGLGEWAQNIWDGIDWSQVDTITSNLSTAFNNAWDQSMTWFQGKLDAINWDNVGTRLGTALETGGAWLLKIADKIPWASLTTAATNALTGIVLKINWTGAFAGAKATAESIGGAVYTGVVNSGLATYLQTAATNFANTIMMAVGSAAVSLANIAMKAGVSPTTVAGVTDATVNEGKGIYNTALNAGKTLLDPIGPYNLLHSTNAQGDYTGFGDFLYKDENGNYQFKYPWSPVELGSSSIWDGSKKTDIGGQFGNTLPKSSGFSENAGNKVLGEPEQFYRTSYDESSGNRITKVDTSYLTSSKQIIEDKEPLLWMDAFIKQRSTLKDAADLATNNCAHLATDFIQDARAYAKATPSPNDDVWANNLKFLGLYGTNSNGEVLNHAVPAYSPSGKWDAGSTYVIEPKGVDLNNEGKLTASNYGPLSTAGSLFGISGFNIEQAKIYDKYSMQDPYTGVKGIGQNQTDFSLENGPVLWPNSEKPEEGWKLFTGVGGTEEKSYPGLESSPLVGDRAVQATYKAAKSSGYEVPHDSDDSGSSSKSSSKSNSKNSESTSKNTEQSAMSLDSIDSTLKSLGNQPVMLSGTRADKSTYQKEFYADDARSIIKELDAAGTKITSIAKLQKDSSGNILPPSDSDIITNKNQLQQENNDIIGKNNIVIGDMAEAVRNFPPELASQFTDVNDINYDAIAKAIGDVYFQGDQSKISGETLKSWDDTIKGTNADLIADLKLLLAGLIENRKVEEKIAEKTDETSKNTKKIAGFDYKDPFKTLTPYVPSVSTSDSSKSPSTQQNKVPYVDQNEAQEEYDPKFYRSYIGATEGYIPWLEQEEGARRISSWGLGAAGKLNGLGLTSGNGDIPTGPYTTQEMVNQAIIKIAPQLDEEELIRLKEKIESEGFNADLLIDTSKADASLTDIKSDASKSTTSIHKINVDNYSVLLAKMENSKSTSSTHTIYTIHKNGGISDFGSGTTTLPDNSVFDWGAPFKRVSESQASLISDLKTSEGTPIDTAEALNKIPWMNDNQKNIVKKMLEIVEKDKTDQGDYQGVVNALTNLNNGNLKFIPEINNCVSGAEKLQDAFIAAGFGKYAAIGDSGSHAFNVISPDETFSPSTSLIIDSTPGQSDDTFYPNWAAAASSSRASFASDVDLRRDFPDTSQTIELKNGVYQVSQNFGMDPFKVWKYLPTDVASIGGDEFSRSSDAIKLNWDTSQVDLLKSTLSEGGQFSISADTSSANASLEEFKTKAIQPTNSKHSIFADNSAPLQAVSLNKQPTWSQHTIYVKQVTNFSKGTSTLSDGSIFSFDAFKSPSIPAFAEGGYTGSYQGEATVHPHEVILNAAQQRGVSDAISGNNSARPIYISIDARGSMETDWDGVVAKIKSALQDDSYR